MSFIAPEHLGKKPFYTCKRIPRKLKKKHMEALKRLSFLDVNEKLWFILGETNREYRDFLINKIVE